MPGVFGSNCAHEQVEPQSLLPLLPPLLCCPAACQEFLAATMHMSKLNREENMMEAFKHFDKDNSGFITKEEIVVGHFGWHCEGE